MLGFFFKINMKLPNVKYPYMGRNSPTTSTPFSKIFFWYSLKSLKEFKSNYNLSTINGRHFHFNASDIIRKTTVSLI